MRLTIPLTGTVLVEGSVWEDGLLQGDDKDPIRPISLDLSNISWQMVDVDLENEVMIIEVQPAETINEPTGEVDGEGNPIRIDRATTNAEKAKFLRDAKKMVESHTKDELYAISKSPRLKRPFKRVN